MQQLQEITAFRFHVGEKVKAKGLLLAIESLNSEKPVRVSTHACVIHPFSHVARAIERDETAGLMKVVVDAANDRGLGAAILGCEGGELVHVLYTPMLGNLRYTLLKGAAYIHPTLAEGFFALLDSVKPAD